MDKKMKISDLMKSIHKGISENLIEFSSSEHDYRYKVDGPQSRNTPKVVAARLNVSETNGTLVSREPISVTDVFKNGLIPVSSRSADHLTGVVSSVICGKIAKGGDSLLKKGSLMISFEDANGSIFNITPSDGFHISSRTENGISKNNGVHPSIKEAVFESCLLGYTKLVNIGLSKNKTYPQHNETEQAYNKTNRANDLGL